MIKSNKSVESCTVFLHYALKKKQVNKYFSIWKRECISTIIEIQLLLSSRYDTLHKYVILCDVQGTFHSLSS